MPDALASDDGVLAVVDPGLGTSSISIRRDGREVARFEAGGGVARIPELLELAAGSFEVDRWLIEVTGFQGVVLQSDLVQWTCEFLDITLEPFHASALEPWGPGLEVEVPSGWPDRLNLHPVAELWAWLRGLVRWRPA